MIGCSLSLHHFFVLSTDSRILVETYGMPMPCKLDLGMEQPLLCMSAYAKMFLGNVNECPKDTLNNLNYAFNAWKLKYDFFNMHFLNLESLKSS